MTFDLSAASRRNTMIDVGLWPDRTLLDYLRDHVEARPDKTALIVQRTEGGPEVRLTYRDLRLSDRAAAGFMRRHIEDGDVVSFQLPNWWQFTVLHLACLKVGARQMAREGATVTMGATSFLRTWRSTISPPARRCRRYASTSPPGPRSLAPWSRRRGARSAPPCCRAGAGRKTVGDHDQD